MSDDHPEPQLPPAATSTAEPASASGPSQSTNNQQPANPEPFAAHSISTVKTEPLAATDPSTQFRRSSGSSAAEMQLDNRPQYSISTSSYPVLHSAQHNSDSPDHSRLIGNKGPANDISNKNSNSDDSERLRQTLSSTSLSHPAQFAFSKPDHNSSAAQADLDSHQQRTSNSSAFETPPVMAPAQLHNTPSQTEEDICMSESPQPEEPGHLKDASSPQMHDKSNDYLNDGQFRQPETPSSQHFYAQRLYDQRSSTHPSQSATPPADSTQQQSSRPGSESTVQRTPEGVSMPARSAVLYHAGYNSGRGAVWRFFKVVEARVSGNTDRAECLLCHKRMLGKSADMKKHIVSNCPNRNEIAQDMQPILEIVKAELENPKKRAKRNSNTPYTMRSDGSFAPVSSSYHPAPSEHTPVPARLQPASVHPPSVISRTPTHHRTAPYELHPTHPDAHRAKMIKYS
ncbi:hypothetical protein IWW36_004981, partial [Coemansia brasiliensis]